MNKQFIFRLFLLTIISFSTNLLIAQPKPKPKPTAKFNPSLIKTSIGILSGKNITATAEQCKEVIGQPLLLIDNKGTPYKLLSYQFAYKKLDVAEDENTGKISQISNLSAGKFWTTPLPEVWQTNVKESVHTGEELYIFEIIGIDKKGHNFFAPSIKITVQ